METFGIKIHARVSSPEALISCFQLPSDAALNSWDTKSCTGRKLLLKEKLKEFHETFTHVQFYLCNLTYNQFKKMNTSVFWKEQFKIIGSQSIWQAKRNKKNRQPVLQKVVEVFSCQIMEMYLTKQDLLSLFSPQSQEDDIVLNMHT